MESGLLLLAAAAAEGENTLHSERHGEIRKGVRVVRGQFVGRMQMSHMSSFHRTIKIPLPLRPSTSISHLHGGYSEFG